MAIYGYTKNYKLIKPQFNTDTWHDYIYDNLDTIDAVMSAIYASGNWKGFWATNTTYTAGDVIIDQATDTMYKVMVDHVTSANTFAEEQTAHPDYYELWSPNNLAESWAIKTDDKVSNTDYSAKAYAISSGLIDDGSAKEWAIGSGAIGNTNEYSAKKYATDAHNDYISMTTNVNVVAVGSNINNVNTVGQSISNVNTVAGDISSVNTVAGVSTDVTTVAGISTDVSTVANNSANVTTVATNISDVNTAALNIEAIKDATTAATNAAQSATNAANSAKDSANSATASATSANNSHIWAEGTDAQVAALGGVHSSKGWAEQSTSVNVSLTNTPYTTNRILEIPQDIKLELNNGTLTLKAGSKVYVPNGVGTFDVYSFPSDVSTTPSGSSGIYGWYLMVQPNKKLTRTATRDLVYSGETAPSGSQYMYWYDTANNLMKFTRDSGSTWTSGYSLPIALISGENGVESIDQVFNGFGYIGSTVFALPGVKVQIPNGRNEDGTCRSIITTVDSVKTITRPDSITNNTHWYLASNLSAFSSTSLIFDANKNIYVSPTGVIAVVEIARGYLTSGKITSFEPYTVDSVANSNASNFSQAGRSYLSGLGMPSNRYIDLTLGASGSTYTAPANGTFYFRKRSTAAGQYISLANLSNKTFEEYYSSNSNQDFGISMNVLKGVAISANYTFGGTTHEFKFVYAQGDQ